MCVLCTGIQCVWLGRRVTVCVVCSNAYAGVRYPFY